jgi:hypothetical protein
VGRRQAPRVRGRRARGSDAPRGAVGSGHAATALSELLGETVDIEYTETLLATIAEAADRIGAAAELSAVIDTPVARRGRLTVRRAAPRILTLPCR